MLLSRRVLRSGLLLLLLATMLYAQRGDQAGEVQASLPAELRLPAPPILTPSQALAALHVEAGFRVELFAAEPLVVAPVALRFDEFGRLWVVEMRGYMPDVDGRGEDDATGCIAVLEDTDGDGRADKRTVFADDLVLPRALALVDGGVLVLEPPWLRFYADADGDLDYEKDSIVMAGFGGRHNPEHAPNALVPGLDNWLHWANHPFRMRWTDGRLQLEPSLSTGQWGAAQDDLGRLFFNSNSDQLRASLIPAHLAVRNAAARTPGIADLRVAEDQHVFPARITPGINRGYQPGMLREGRLDRFTGACSPFIHRGATFPVTHRGNAYVCEPCAHLLRRNVLEDRGGLLHATNGTPGSEFLKSTDERFRPVALAEGLDGALYVADMARGVIQHRMFVTSFLRQQIVDRRLEQPTDLGRIWRVVPTKPENVSVPRLGKRSTEELVALLTHPGGAVRDTAQRLLVQRGSLECAPALTQLANQAGAPLPRLHALRTLEGLHALTAATVLQLCATEDALVRAEAVLLLPRCAQDCDAAALRTLITALMHDDVVRVQQHTALMLGALPQATSALALRTLFCAKTGATLRELALTGLAGREAQLASEYAQAGVESDGINELVRCVVAGRGASGITHLLESGANSSEQARLVLLRALERACAEVKPRRPILLSQAPPVQLLHHIAADSALLAAVQWIGREGGPALPPGLDARGAALREQGATLYQQHCAPCHQQDGRGMEGVAASLHTSTRVTADPELVARILLHGFSSGTIERQPFGTEMPAFARLGDEELAAILTFTRRSFGHAESAVMPTTLAEVRRQEGARKLPWTAGELDIKIPPR